MSETTVAGQAAVRVPGEVRAATRAAAATLAVEEIVRREDLDRHLEEWSALVECAPEATLFESPEFLLPWLDAFWCPRPLAFQLVRSGRRLVGLVPLLAGVAGPGACPGSLSLAVNEHNGRGGILREEASPAVLEAALAHALRRRPGQRLGFGMILSRSALFDDVQALAGRRGLGSCVRQSVASPVVRIEGTWEAYLAGRAAHVRSALRRKRKKLGQAGQLHLECTSGVAGWRAAFADVLRVERRSWKHAAGSSLTARPQVGAFYERLTRVLAERGWLRLYLLYLDGEPIAHLCAASFRGELWGLMPSYVEDLRQLSPGIVLATLVLQQAFERREESCFDLLGIESRWKRELANGERAHANVCLATRRDLRCLACRIGQRHVKPVVQDHLPTFLRAWRALLARRWRAAAPPSCSNE